MIDPFPIAPVPWLAAKVQPLADYFDLPTLPIHVHEILAAALMYSILFYPISPILSRLLAPKHYSKLSRKRRINWDVHVVSMFQSILINGLALWVMLTDKERAQMDRQERVWGYDGASGFIQALAAGYFLWDLAVTSTNLDVFGFGDLAHAIAALLVFSLGFVGLLYRRMWRKDTHNDRILTCDQRPFVNYYACVFILWELSTPFLNVHWFMDKLDMTGTRAQLYNGIMLLTTFFSCRLVYGTYSSFRVFQDVWAGINTNPGLESLALPTMRFASSSSTVPMWLGVAYLASNLTLNSLNFYWFFMMIRAVRKRFVPNDEAAKEPTLATGVDVDATSVASSVGKPATTRRRKA